ncbi:uncharacterized [Tachysurus ichikawai]
MKCFGCGKTEHLLCAHPNRNNDKPNIENENSSAELVSSGPSGAGSAEAEPTAETKPAVEEEYVAGPAEAELTATEPTHTGTSENTSTPNTDNKQINSDIE